MKQYVLILATTLIQYSYGQVLIADKEIQTEISNDTLLIHYYENGLELFATSDVILTNQNPLKNIKLKGLNDSSLLQVQTDTKGGYIEIKGLTDYKTDTIKISGLRLIENSLDHFKKQQINYYRAYSDRDSFEYLRSKQSQIMIHKGHDLDSVKDYNLSINDTTYNLKLTIQDKIIDRFHFNGASRKYKRHYKIFGHEPKKYKKLGGETWIIQPVWTGMLNLNPL